MHTELFATHAATSVLFLQPLHTDRSRRIAMWGTNGGTQSLSENSTY